MDSLRSLARAEPAMLKVPASVFLVTELFAVPKAFFTSSHNAVLDVASFLVLASPYVWLTLAPVLNSIATFSRNMTCAVVPASLMPRLLELYFTYESAFWPLLPTADKFKSLREPSRDDKLPVAPAPDEPV